MNDDPRLRHPVMIAAFEGWNDAGDAASAAIDHLSLMWDADVFDEIDPEQYYDFQVARPSVNIRHGVARRLSWRTTTVTQVHLPNASRDALLVHGIEPSFHWRGFCDELVSIALECDVSQLVSLGSLLADVAHTEPVPVTGSAHDEDTAAALNLAETDYDGPAGITAALADAMTQTGIRALSLWAAVPHYVSDPPSPNVTLALLRRLEEAADIAVPLGSIPQQAQDWVAEVTRLAADDDDISEYIHSLQERDREATSITPVSGDSLAAEFQRYLSRRRRQR